MGDKAWKAAERAVALALGGKRDVFAFSEGDVTHPTLCVDVKRRLHYTLKEARADLAKLGAASDKLPMVATVDIPGRGHKAAATLVVMRLDDFVRLMKLAQEKTA